MKRVRCERQAQALLVSMVLFAAASVLVVATSVHVSGPAPVFLVMGPVMLVYLATCLKGSYEALTSYEYDEEGVSRDFMFGRTVAMRWSDVRDFWIRRSTGDAAVFLKDGGGRSLRLDFQLMGPAGRELFGLMSRSLHPIVLAKLERMERELVHFRRRHIGWVPLPGSVSAGRGVIQTHGPAAVSIELAKVEEVVVKEVRKLTTTHHYSVKGDGRRLQFLSFLDDSPLLLRYLRSNVPEERWRSTSGGGVFFAKLMGLAIVPIMALSALVMLGQTARSIAVERALARRSARASATVLGSEALGRDRYRLSYTFGLPAGQEGFGEALVGGVVPSVGQKIDVLYDPEEPFSNLPVSGQGFTLPSALPLLGAFVAQLVLSIPYAIATIAFKVREDPFAVWFS